MVPDALTRLEVEVKHIVGVLRAGLPRWRHWCPNALSGDPEKLGLGGAVDLQPLGVLLDLFLRRHAGLLLEHLDAILGVVLRRDGSLHCCPLRWQVSKRLAGAGGIARDLGTSSTAPAAMVRGQQRCLSLDGALRRAEAEAALQQGVHSGRRRPVRGLPSLPTRSSHLLALSPPGALAVDILAGAEEVLAIFLRGLLPNNLEARVAHAIEAQHGPYILSTHIARLALLPVFLDHAPVLLVAWVIPCALRGLEIEVEHVVPILCASLPGRRQWCCNPFSCDPHEVRLLLNIDREELGILNDLIFRGCTLGFIEDLDAARGPRHPPSGRQGPG
mmetsp:Transcript_18804/g.41295  ORF Transcript_18804/g.41295 Transcript_18804/m.41295 type:complete len:331 (-) Transcript_18804:20-1012(-)